MNVFGICNAAAGDRRHGSIVKRRALSTVSGLTLIAAASLAGFHASAALAAAPQAADASELEEIVVTGTRVIRDGYQAPTPLTVVGVDQIRDAAPANIAEFVMTLPSLVGNTTPQSSRTSMTAGGVGLNTPSARSLGSSRTLILLDGQRNVGSQPTGQVDINTFPQQLISRVDVVTGGASAAYGSDALAGVINFVLDRKFTGLKGEVQGGVTTYGDDRTFNVSVSGGTPFANDRGHFLLSGEIAKNYGIKGAPRAWAKQGWQIINNPAYVVTAGVGNGAPQRLVTSQAAQTAMTPGGIITTGPLKGTAFGPGGVPYQFNYGSLVLAPWMVGGEWKANDLAADGADLDPEEGRQNAFTRVSYEITDDIEVFAQYGYAFGTSYSTCCNHFAAGDLTIKADNAFIPAEVRARMTALGLATLTMGSYFSDLPFKLVQDVDRTVHRYVIGANGNFDAFGTVWSWDAYFQKGNAHIRKSFYDRFKSKYVPAIDAVRSPTTGAIVCRSTLTTPGNGCSPWNVFGVGVNTTVAADYIAGWSYALETNKQGVMAASATGEPFDLWAGPVSLAFGAEHRKEAVGGIESAANAINDAFIGNSRPTVGSYSVTEGFLETVVPLAKDASWAYSLEFNAAVRATDYSTSGYVTTWKAGATYNPIQDIRFRITRSRDIRAPHNVELFASGIFVGNLVNDPFRGGVPTNVQSETSGNPNLKPEKADTTGIGVVYQPSFLPGLSASVDYYNINIKDVIGTVGRQEVPDRCFRGEQSFCDSLVFVNGILSIVRTVPTNFIKQVNRGMDFEASYYLALDDVVPGWAGDLTLRGLATRYIKQLQDTGTGIGIVNTVGGNLRTWKYTFSATYAYEPFRFTLSGRGVNAGVYNVTNIECTTGCPTSTTLKVTQNINSLPGAFYLDASLRHQFMKSENGTAETYLSIRNLTDKDPAIQANGPAGTAHSGIPCASANYDCVGRVFRAGVRFQM